ncbi:hypothetical protein CLV30_110167 [Haloactinopolyspora alba]|uniref:Secreted protein n=1 Tax=Haloactinopolyspora alba TaxID=648780 RepID=A0A2P8DZ67_9ACTN|nr:hypothetical protein [Haloactinopolyspora alba]PSL02512.1 hypothetical protein CLV30_110167 [Haloactinopolyspora alba]
MPGRRAHRRLPRTLWGLPAILLSGVFMLLTVATPATAASAAPAASAADRVVGADADDVHVSVVAGARELRDAVAGPGLPGNDTDAPAPPSSFVDVEPLDRAVAHPPVTRADARASAPVGSTTDPDRGPPPAARR